MLEASGDFILARRAESRRQTIQFVDAAHKGHQAIRSPAMPDPQQMPGFMNGDLGGSQIRSRRIFISQPMKRDYGSFAAKLGFAEYEFKNRRAEVALNDSQLESCSIIDRFERFDYFSCRILAAEG